jgi:hypothetical protein
LSVCQAFFKIIIIANSKTHLRFNLRFSQTFCNQA